jgi:hypothetical protein
MQGSDHKNHRKLRWRIANICGDDVNGKMNPLWQ